MSAPYGYGGVGWNQHSVPTVACARRHRLIPRGQVFFHHLTRTFLRHSRTHADAHCDRPRGWCARRAREGGDRARTHLLRGSIDAGIRRVRVLWAFFAYNANQQTRVQVEEGEARSGYGMGREGGRWVGSAPTAWRAPGRRTRTARRRRAAARSPPAAAAPSARGAACSGTAPAWVLRWEGWRRWRRRCCGKGVGGRRCGRGARGGGARKAARFLRRARRPVPHGPAAAASCTAPAHSRARTPTPSGVDERPVVPSTSRAPPRAPPPHIIPPLTPPHTHLLC